jgi:hypothetical protein
MTSILSSVSAQFGKALILGTVLPVSIFVSAGLLLAQMSLGGSLQDLLTNLEKGWQVLTLPFVAIVISVLLFNLNVPLTRLYEGNPWKGSWLGRRCTAAHQRQLDALGARLDRAAHTAVFYGSPAGVRLTVLSIHRGVLG